MAEIKECRKMEGMTGAKKSAKKGEGRESVIKRGE